MLKVLKLDQIFVKVNSMLDSLGLLSLSPATFDSKESKQIDIVLTHFRDLLANDCLELFTSNDLARRVNFTCDAFNGSETRVNEICATV